MQSLPSDTQKGTLTVFKNLEVTVARASGPTIARWQLGAQLKSLRETAGVTHRNIAAEIGCSESKIYKIEAGDVGLGRSDLLVMLGKYGVTDPQRPRPCWISRDRARNAAGGRATANYPGRTRCT